MTDLAELKGKLAYAEERLEAAREALAIAESRGDAAHEMGGGIPGFGGSGNQRAARQVRGALNSAHKAQMEALERIDKWEYRVKRLTSRVAEAERVRFTREDVVGAVFVHDGRMWRKVVRINQKTVSVVHWQVPTFEPDRIPFDKITAVKKVAS